MKKFSDFGIELKDDKNIFQVPVISISEIINCEIEIMDFESGIKTRHGDNRYVIKINFEGFERKFFTNASPIKEALDKVPKSEFPFLTTIKQKSFGTGSGKTFQLT